MHIEAILTQLVFEHSMRIRINASTSDSKKPDTKNLPPPPDSPPDSQPANEAPTQADGKTTERTDGVSPPSVSDRSSESTASISTAVAVETPQNTKDALPDGNKSLIGVMTNLVTTDLDNLKTPAGHLLDTRP